MRLSADFGAWLADEMKRRNLSQRTVGLHSGIDHSSIHRIVTGGREPTYRTARKIVDALGHELHVHPKPTLPPPPALHRSSSLE